MDHQKQPAQAAESRAASQMIAEGGNLRHYLRILLSDPEKMISGVLSSLAETFLFCFLPRFPVGVGFAQRLSLVLRFIIAEIKIPGTTTLLETLWLTYMASMAGNNKELWVEVGCFKGLSSSRLSLVCKHFGARMRVYDTFAGLPGTDEFVYEAVDGRDSFHFQSGAYAGSLEEVRAHVKQYGAADVVEFIPGDVKDTLGSGIDTAVGFAFLDVDLVDSYATCFLGLSPGIKTGTTIVIHEAVYRPVRELIENREFWSGAKLEPPRITYLAEKYNQRFLRCLAVLSW